MEQNVVAVRGGGIDEDIPIEKQWILETTTIADRKYVQVDTTHYLCRKYLKNNASMVEYIKSQRSLVVDFFMKLACSGVDPLGGPPPEEMPMPKRSRKEMVDEIADSTALTLYTLGGAEHKVWVGTAWHAKTSLVIEATAANFALVLEAPPASAGIDT